MIRLLSEEDLAELAKLRAPDGATTTQRRRANIALTQLYPKLFLRTPTYRSDICGLVSAGTEGRLTGMIAMGARPMLCDGRPITAAIGADLYVAKDARKSMAGFALMKGLLNGPQDVTISDVANDKTRQLWERLGGFVASGWNINWIGILRPCRLVADMVQERRAGRVPGGILKTISPVLDRFAPDSLRCNVPSVRTALRESTLTSVEFSQHILELTCEESVQPVYSASSAAWMWQRLPYLSPDSGSVSAVTVRNRNGRLLGWYIYTLNPGGIARVAQIAARSADAEAVVNHLFARVFAEGAAAVAGRMQPRFQQLLIDRGCLLRGRETYTLIHSRDPDITDAFRSGRAWLSVLDGEAPFNAWNNPAAAVTDLAKLPGGLAISQPAQATSDDVCKV